MLCSGRSARASLCCIRCCLVWWPASVSFLPRCRVTGRLLWNSVYQTPLISSSRRSLRSWVCLILRIHGCTTCCSWRLVGQRVDPSRCSLSLLRQYRVGYLLCVLLVSSSVGILWLRFLCFFLRYFLCVYISS